MLMTDANETLRIINRLFKSSFYRLYFIFNIHLYGASNNSVRIQNFTTFVESVSTNSLKLKFLMFIFGFQRFLMCFLLFVTNLRTKYFRKILYNSDRNK
jgi:hypothetical protein